MNKSLKARIDLANKWIKFAQRHGIWGEGYFGSTWPVHIEYTHLIDVSPKGNRATVRYDDHTGRGPYREAYNLNDEYSVGDLRHEISNYIIKAIKNGAKSDGVPLPKFNPRRRRNPQVDLPGMKVRGRSRAGHGVARANPRRITRKADLKGDRRYTIWTYSPQSDYYNIERSYPGRYVRDAMWDDIRAYNRTSRRQYVVFPHGFDPNRGK